MRELQDKPGYALALILMLGMSIAIWAMQPVASVVGNYGLCIPSPNCWQLPPIVSGLCAGGMVLGISLLAIFLNKQFGLVNGSTILFASIFLVMSGGNPWIIQWFGTSTILAFVSLIALWMLFSCYGQKDVTHRVFVLFTLFSFGSMIQYSFLLVALAFMVGLSYMRIMRLREFLAMLCGLIAPYWICLGFGLVQFNEINWPHLTNLFAQGLPTHELTGLLLFAVAGAVITLLLSFLNYNTVFATNGQVRGCNGFINLLGIFCVWFMIFDFNNIVAYMGLLNLLAGIQVAHFCKNTRIRREYLIPIGITVIYLGIFILTLYDWS